VNKLTAIVLALSRFIKELNRYRASAAKRKREKRRDEIKKNPTKRFSQLFGGRASRIVRRDGADAPTVRPDTPDAGVD